METHRPVPWILSLRIREYLTFLSSKTFPKFYMCVWEAKNKLIEVLL